VHDFEDLAKDATESRILDGTMLSRPTKNDVSIMLNVRSRATHRCNTLGTFGYCMNQYKRGFTAIYGFTSDQQGIRHTPLEKDKHQLLCSIGPRSGRCSPMMAQNEAGEP
jgi:hypothetical protein